MSEALKKKLSEEAATIGHVIVNVTAGSCYARFDSNDQACKDCMIRECCKKQTQKENMRVAVTLDAVVQTQSPEIVNEPAPKIMKSANVECGNMNCDGQHDNTLCQSCIFPVIKAVKSQR